MKCIVDTNVAKVANGKETDASEECQLACIDALSGIVKGIATIYIDEQGCIFEEYRRHLDFSGQPGVGDEFFRHLFHHQYDIKKCRIIPITPKDDSFEEFPDDPGLAGFDLSDRKFVAVAVAAGKEPSIWNAVDTDWEEYAVPLKNNGIKVKQLCVCNSKSNH